MNISEAIEEFNKHINVLVTARDNLTAAQRLENFLNDDERQKILSISQNDVVVTLTELAKLDLTVAARNPEKVEISALAVEVEPALEIVLK